MAPSLQRIGKRPSEAVVLICAAVLLVIWLSTFQRMDFEREQAVAATMHSNSNLAIAFEQQTSRTLMAAEQVAALVREQYLRTGDNIGLAQWAEQRVIREDMFTIISVINAEGNVVDSSYTSARANYSDRDFFKAQRDSQSDELFINPPVIGRISGEARVPMSLRMSRPDGSFAGVVILSVGPSNFTGFYNQADLGGRGMLELTGLDGVVRARKIGQENSYGQDARQLGWFVRQSESQTGSFIDDGALLDGVARIVSYRVLPGYPVMVAVGTAYDDALAPVLQRRTYYLAAAGAGSAILLVFAYLLIVQLDRRRKTVIALEASEVLYRATFHQAATGIARATPEGEILEANQKFHDMLGFESDELNGRMLVELSDPDCRHKTQRFLARCVSEDVSGASSEIEKSYRRKDGSRLWVHEALGVVREADGSPLYLVIITQDITKRKELEARLSYDAMHDMLTGLANRNMFYDRLDHVLASARRNGRLAAVLYMDLDGFKEVNDTHGHAVGDMLLQHVAQRLQNSMRAEDTVARFGGDEFAIVLAAISTETDSQKVIIKLAEVLSEPYQIEGFVLQISASMGAAVFPVNGADARALILHADGEMYAAKRIRQKSAES